jgi:hypothetical protein
MAKKCLILMPFSDPDGTNSEHWDRLYTALSRRIHTILSDHECEQFKIGAGVILPNLLAKIVGSDLIICELTYLKPNVLFELGASIVLGKPTILLARSASTMPSDISNYAFITYSFDEQLGALTFPSSAGCDLLEKSLKFMTVRYTPESFINTDSNLAKILKAISNTLKHAIQLETENAILAPALRSLFNNLVSENARELSDFIENNKKSVTISIESPKILFDVLIALLNSLAPADRYDSITWKKHWIGGNEQDSERFLRAILKSAYNLPAMRRVFLVGVNSFDNDAWLVDQEDRIAVKGYFDAIRNLRDTVQNRVLFLPLGLVDPVAEVCHMGRITKDTSVIYVFSQYSDAGLLNSFRLVRDKIFDWDYEDFWDLSVPMGAFNWSSEPLIVSPDRARFSGPSDNTFYEPLLEKLLHHLGVLKTVRLIA